MRAALRFLRLLPLQLELVYLHAAARQVHPLNKDAPFIALRIAELEASL